MQALGLLIHGYRYGGIYEKGSREYTLDDFYALQLDKLDRYICLKKSDVIIPEGEEESSSDEDNDEDDDDSESDDDESTDVEDANDGGKEIDDNEKGGQDAGTIDEEMEVEEVQEPDEQPEVCNPFLSSCMTPSKESCRMN